MFIVGLILYFFFIERQSDRLRLYNLASVGEERQWLRDVLLSSESEISSDDDSPAAKEQRIRRLLKERHFHNKYAKEYYKDQGVCTEFNIKISFFISSLT